MAGTSVGVYMCLLLGLLQSPYKGAFVETVSVYLAGQHGSNYGRVEINNNEVRGTICDDAWDNNDAKVVCRQLGLPTSYATALSGAALGSGSGPVWMDEVNCGGSESDIASCTFPGYGKEDCSHIEDASVLCQGVYVSIYLGGTHGTNFGRIQVVTGKNSSIGTICDDSWDNNDAKVTCRQLGHPTSNAKAFGSARFGVGSGPIWLDDVRCNGTESNLYACGSNAIGINNCQHAEDAGVICGYDLSVRLLNVDHTPKPYEGIVQVLLKGTWVGISYSSVLVKPNMTSVLCRNLGISNTATNQAYQVKSSITRTRYAQLVTYLKCDGTESNIGHCQFTVTVTPVLDLPSDYSTSDIVTYLICGVSAFSRPQFLNISHQDNNTILVARGVSTTLKCRTEPSRPKQYITWTTLGNALDHSVRNTLEIDAQQYYSTTSELTFVPDVRRHNGTRVYCSTYNDYGHTNRLRSTTGVIKVGVAVTNVEVTFAGQHNITNITNGDSVVLTCSSSFSDPPPLISWFLNGDTLNVELYEDYDSNTTVEYEGSLYKTVSMLQYTSRDNESKSLSFYCEADNIPYVERVKSQEMELHVSVPVSFTESGTSDAADDRQYKSIFFYTVPVLAAIVLICIIVVTCLIVRFRRISRKEDQAPNETTVIRSPPSGPCLVSGHTNEMYMHTDDEESGEVDSTSLPLEHYESLTFGEPNPQMPSIEPGRKINVPKMSSKKKQRSPPSSPHLQLEHTEAIYMNTDAGESGAVDSTSLSMEHYESLQFENQGPQRPPKGKKTIGQADTEEVYENMMQEYE